MNAKEIITAAGGVFRAADNDDYTTAVVELAELVDAGETALASEILRKLCESKRPVQVEQSMQNVEAGSTVVGYRGRL